MHAPRTWILIADAAHARVLEATGRTQPLVDVPSMSLHVDLPPTHELGSERPGRTHDSIGSGRHAVEPRTDAHRELKRTFAALVSQRLEAALTAKAFDRLVLVCPPAMLGDIRNDMNKHVSDCLLAEVPKDLVKVPNHEIRVHLEPFVVL